DTGNPAELFMAKRKGGSQQPLRYRRFATAAEAIRFAVEELPAVRASGAWMQVGDQRFDGDDIQRLYESDDFPLQRRLSERLRVDRGVTLIAAEDPQRTPYRASGGLHRARESPRRRAAARCSLRLNRRGRDVFFLSECARDRFGKAEIMKRGQ